MALEQWAKSQAEDLMAPLGDRWSHVQAVADQARRVGLVLTDEDRDVLVAAAYLHDIGYAPSLNRLGFHPVDGARFLRDHGHERLACLVAHHSGARFEAEERGLLDELAAFPIEDGPVLDALTFADMTTGPAGEAMTLQERIGEILRRYPPDGPVHRAIRRALALDPVTVAALRKHRARQHEHRLLIGAGYQDSGLVFTWPDGSAIHPLRFSRWFEQHARRAGLPRIRLNDLWHSYASAALAAGVPAKVISERLGHATIAVTMDIYSHVLPGLDREAADSVARLTLGGGDASPRAP